MPRNVKRTKKARAKTAAKRASPARKRRAARRRYEIGFVGGGNMATALIEGFINAGLYRPAQVCAADIDAARRRALERRLRIAATADNAELVRDSQVVILAVKPQNIQQVLGEARPGVRPRQLFISIVTGASTRKLEEGLGSGARVIRVMPNTPALLGHGMAAVVRGRGATAADERLALKLMRAVGKARALGDERLIDAVTGLSGSGPAYVYHFAEAFIAAGVAAGLPPAVAEELALQSIMGAAVMLQRSGETPQRLREMVTSPGGTTLAGLNELERRGFAVAVVEAVLAAKQRATELGRE